MPTSYVTPAQLLEKIRYDPGTKKGSVLDVVHIVTNREKKHASTTLKSILDKYPDISENITYFKFEGYKQRPTKVADVATLMEIAWLCPGKHAMKFRAAGAVNLCRALGGDLSLADEIQQRRNEITEEEQAALLACTGVTTAEATGHAVESAAQRECRIKHEKRMAELREERAKIARLHEQYARLRERDARWVEGMREQAARWNEEATRLREAKSAH